MDLHAFRCAVRATLPILAGLCLLATAGLAATPEHDSAADPVRSVRPLVIGEQLEIDSATLGERRRINVYLPAGYAEAPDRRWPVLYMPDGGLGEDFLHVAGLLQVLAANGGMRPFLLVGIENTERRRDLTGPTADPKDREIAPRVGGSAAFRTFLRDELRPEIMRRYRVGSESGIVGESLAGLFVIETFLLEPELFDHYLAIDPSLWWNGNAALAAVREPLPAERYVGRQVFVAVSSEPKLSELAETFVQRLRKDPPAGLHIEFARFPAETHLSVYHPAALQALRAVFAVD